MSKQEEIEVQIPTEENENVGAVEPKKKQKKRKSKEERVKDRKVVAVFLVVTLIVSLIFYWLPRIKGESKKSFSRSSKVKIEERQQEDIFKGYTEVDF